MKHLKMERSEAPSGNVGGEEEEEEEGRKVRANGMRDGVVCRQN